MLRSASPTTVGSPMLIFAKSAKRGEFDSDPANSRRCSTATTRVYFPTTTFRRDFASRRFRRLHERHERSRERATLISALRTTVRARDSSWTSRNRRKYGTILRIRSAVSRCVPLTGIWNACDSRNEMRWANRSGQSNSRNIAIDYVTSLFIFSESIGLFFIPALSELIHTVQ